MSISPVLTAAPAEPDVAAAFFAVRLACQTDVSDVAAALASGRPGFVLLDTRSDAAWAQGRIPGARHLRDRGDPARGPRPGRSAGHLLLGARMRRCDAGRAGGGPPRPARQGDARRAGV